MMFTINGFTFRMTTPADPALCIEVRVCDLVETFTNHRTALAWIFSTGKALA